MLPEIVISFHSVGFPGFLCSSLSVYTPHIRARILEPQQDSKCHELHRGVHAFDSVSCEAPRQCPFSCVVLILSVLSVVC